VEVGKVVHEVLKVTGTCPPLLEASFPKFVFQPFLPTYEVQMVLASMVEGKVWLLLQHFFPRISLDPLSLQVQ